VADSFEYRREMKVLPPQRGTSPSVLSPLGGGKVVFLEKRFCWKEGGWCQEKKGIKGFCWREGGALCLPWLGGGGSGFGGGGKVYFFFGKSCFWWGNVVLPDRGKDRAGSGSSGRESPSFSAGGRGQSFLPSVTGGRTIGHSSPKVPRGKVR